jgi:hypothetical protein
MTHSLKGMLKEWVRKTYKGTTVQTRSFASLIGSLSFLRVQLPRARLHSLALHSNLAKGVKSGGWNGSVTLKRNIRSELLRWFWNIVWNTPFDFAYNRPSIILTADTAEAGWGDYLLICTQFWTTSGFFQLSDNLTSSNQRETPAVWRSLTEFLSTLQSLQVHSLTLQSDNMRPWTRNARNSHRARW